MCEPVTLAVIGGSIAAAQVVGENDERIKSNSIKAEAANLHRRVFANKVEGVDQEFRGKQVAASEAKQQRSIEAMQARADSQVGASASGVTGLSVDAVLDDFTRQEGVGNSTIDNSLELQKDSTNTAVKGLALGTEGALFNLRKEHFNPVAAALKIGSGAFSGFSAGTAGGKGTGNKGQFEGVSNDVASSVTSNFKPPTTNFGPRRNFT